LNAAGALQVVAKTEKTVRMMPCHQSTKAAP
jgi:hypothetical protein